MGRDRSYLELSARERQIMETLFRRGRATVVEIREELDDPPSAAAVRTMLARLEDKGCLRHARVDARNVYFATLPREEARRSALQRMMRTFFDGSPVQTVASILDTASADLPAEELDRLAEMIEQARTRER